MVGEPVELVGGVGDVALQCGYGFVGFVRAEPQDTFHFYLKKAQYVVACNLTHECAFVWLEA